jgi:hypothetical protein
MTDQAQGTIRVGISGVVAGFLKIASGRKGVHVVEKKAQGMGKIFVLDVTAFALDSMITDLARGADKASGLGLGADQRRMITKAYDTLTSAQASYEAAHEPDQAEVNQHIDEAATAGEIAEAASVTEAPLDVELLTQPSAFDRPEPIAGEETQSIIATITMRSESFVKPSAEVPRVNTVSKSVAARLRTEVQAVKNAELDRALGALSKDSVDALRIAAEDSASRLAVALAIVPAPRNLAALKAVSTRRQALYARALTAATLPA